VVSDPQLETPHAQAAAAGAFPLAADHGGADGAAQGEPRARGAARRRARALGLEVPGLQIEAWRGELTLRGEMLAADARQLEEELGRMRGVRRSYNSSTRGAPPVGSPCGRAAGAPPSGAGPPRLAGPRGRTASRAVR